MSISSSKTANEFINNYKGKVKFYYKHLPLDFHDMAKISSQYYEAIKMQDQQKAGKFMDTRYANQDK